MTPVPKRMCLVRSAAKDEDFRRRDDLKPGRVVLADPRLVKPELVEPRHQLEIAFEALRRVFLVRMEGGKENPVAQVDLGHYAASLIISYAMLSSFAGAENISARNPDAPICGKLCAANA
jgi:hypothetical protein